MIKDKLMRESPFYNDLVEDISAETRTKWIKEGREEGMERGVEGSITTVLAARFGAVPDRLSGRVGYENSCNHYIPCECCITKRSLREINSLRA